MTFKVYLAAAYAARDSLRGYAEDLAKFDIEVTSTWLAETQRLVPATLGAAADRSDATLAQHSHDNFADIADADAVVVFTGDFQKPLVAPDLPDLLLHTGGRHIETGYALALGKPVIVIGDPENVFHRGVCTIVPTWLAALDLLDDLATDATEHAA